MLDETRGSDYAIWCVAALLYACDAARLLAPRELLLVEAGGGGLSAVFSSQPFTLAGRVLAFAPLLRPDRGVFVAPWGEEWRPAAALAAALDGLGRLRASLRVARVLAAAGFALLFIAGPILTLRLGPNAAVVYVGVLLYPIVAAAVGHVWWRRRRLGLSRGQAALVSVEVAICPALLPNLVRKITAAHALGVDGGQLLSAAATPAVRDEILGRVAERAEDLIETASPGSAESDQLRRYLLTLQKRA